MGKMTQMFKVKRAGEDGVRSLQPVGCHSIIFNFRGYIWFSCELPSKMKTPPTHPGAWDPRTEPGLNRSCRGPFRSPRPSPKSGQAYGTSEEFLNLDIQKLKDKREMLDKEIYQLISEGYSVDERDDHISQLHEYNDIKDVGQMLLGKLAVIRGVTTKELYPEFDLDMSD
ncbi:DNA repair protein SWI5 homolog [Dipodomys spectabilis]|uniref:DNA repair protein SWI5 homolog n=1 Tax=Dipodomys spectabilis TaxID=105255 RepID=UPI001C536830|nr:DNA repair protein SWI5 homolog [Dipodomys spectabilis]